MLKVFYNTYDKYQNYLFKKSYTDKKSSNKYFSKNPIDNMNNLTLWDSIHKI